MTTMTNSYAPQTNFALNTSAAQLLGLPYDLNRERDLVVVIRDDGQPSRFNPCEAADQTSELVQHALNTCETRFKAQLYMLSLETNIPYDYVEQIAVCKQNTRKFTLAAVVALQEHHIANRNVTKPAANSL